MSKKESRNCKLFNIGYELTKKGFQYKKIKTEIHNMNSSFDKSLNTNEIKALLRIFKSKTVKLNSIEDLLVHKSGKIGKISGFCAWDGALLVFEMLDENSGDCGSDIFYTEIYECKQCDRKTYNKMYPPEDGCVKWEEHFYNHILINEGLDTEKQMYIKECPHCGGYGENGEKYVGPYHKIITEGEMNRVKCIKCGAKGPKRFCLPECIAAYNERWNK